MKNILKTTIFTLFTILLVSCTNDKEPITSLNGFEYRDVSEVSSPAVLLDDNASEVYKKLEWDRANYGVPVSAAYKIVVTDHDNDPTFLNEIEFDGVYNDNEPDISKLRKETLSVGEFNVAINKLPTFNCGVMNIDIRIKSILGTSSNQQIQYTAPKTVTVTGYPTKPKALSFSNVNGSTFSANLASSGFKSDIDYEGYLYLEPGDYKFYQPDACGSFTSPIVYGADAGGVLVAGGGANININTAGHYYITANLKSGELKYTTQFYKTFGVFGTAVKLPPAAVVPMAGNNSNIWTITIDLFKGRLLRFRSNDWTGELAGNEPKNIPPGTSKLVTTLGLVGPSLTNVTGTDGGIKLAGDNDGTKQKYKITLDVSKPRAYTYKLELVE